MLRWKILALILFSGVLALAQVRPRDYTISLPRVSFSADGSTAVIGFVVTNQGGDAIEASQVVITENLTGQVQVAEELPSLAAGSEQAYTIELRLADLPEPDLFFKIEAGIDDYELAGSPIAKNNIQIFRINKANVSDAGGAAAAGSPAATAYDLWLPLVNLGINFPGDGVEVNGRLYSGGDLLVARRRGSGAAMFCLVAAEFGAAAGLAPSAQVRAVAGALRGQHLV